MAVASVKSGPSAAQVREWGREQNAKGESFKGTEAGVRGRLNPALVEAFNKAHKGANAYKPHAHVPTVTVTAKPEKGRAVERKVNVAQARQALAAAGQPVGKRGRISQAQMSAYVLGTL